jgi:hypothetical protein
MLLVTFQIIIVTHAFISVHMCDLYACSLDVPVQAGRILVQSAAALLQSPPFLNLPFQLSILP